MKIHGKHYGKKVVSILGIPLGTILLFQIICSFQDIALFETSGHILTFIRSTVVIGFTSWALSMNLTSGRFDFSIGAIALLSSMIGAKLTVTYELSALAMFFVILCIGALLGLLSGIVYISLRLPPIITSLGITLVYEAFTYIVTKGEGVLISTNLNLLKLSTRNNLLLILGAGIVFMYYICNHTVFGYNMKALQTGQRIAVNTGIKEKKNAIICYTIAGLLMGVVGAVNLTTRGTASVALNFSSISSMFVAFFPMFLGGFIGRFCEERIGIFLGSLTSAIITLGFVRLDISSQMQSLINAVILLLFLIYLNNEHKIISLFKVQKKAQGENT